MGTFAETAIVDYKRQLCTERRVSCVQNVVVSCVQNVVGGGYHQTSNIKISRVFGSLLRTADNFSPRCGICAATHNYWFVIITNCE
jgi:hypothetical protein